MSFFRKIESGLNSAVDSTTGSFGSALQPARIAKKAEHQMFASKLVSAGVQHAPTLYTVFISTSDEPAIFANYDAIAGEVETYLQAKGQVSGLNFATRPLVRFITSDAEKAGKFSVQADVLPDGAIVDLRAEEASFRNPSSASDVGSTDDLVYLPENSISLPDKSEPADKQPIEDSVDSLESPSIMLDQRAVLPIAEPDVTADVGEIQSKLPTLALSQLDEDRKYSAYLVSKPDGKTIFLDREIITIGRDISNIIMVKGAAVSRAHARLNYTSDKRWRLVDLGSTNGTYVNGLPIQTTVLATGDILTIGNSEYEYLDV